MSRHATNARRRTTGPVAADDAGACLPPVSSRERDFWRRAVAEERARLELTGHAATTEPQLDLH
jgi:hypothetical protein